MARSSPSHHLYKYGRSWTFRFRWPEDVRSQLDKKYELHKSLTTDNIREAMEKRNYLLAFCKQFVTTMRGGNKREINRLKKELNSLNNNSNFEFLSSASDRVGNYVICKKKVLFDKNFLRLVDEAWTQTIEIIGNPDKPRANFDQIILLKNIKETALDLLSSDISVPFDEFIQEWLDVRKDEVTPKTLQDGRLSVAKFKESFPTLDSVKRKYVRKWFEEQSSSYSPYRLQKYKQHLQSYWNFLKGGTNSMHVEEDIEPFRGIRIERRNYTKFRSSSWLPFPNLGKDIVVLLKDANQKGDQQLVNLIILAMYTGMRIEEACSLFVEHIFPDYIYVSATKSTPVIRKIPIHSMLGEPLKLMVKESTDRFVISGLNPRNKSGIRSDPIGKRFSQLKSERGFGPNHVFHSIRKTVITIMEKENVAKRTIDELVGNITPYNIKAFSSMKEQKKAIEMLAYPLENL